MLCHYVGHASEKCLYLIRFSFHGNGLTQFDAKIGKKKERVAVFFEKCTSSSLADIAGGGCLCFFLA